MRHAVFALVFLCNAAIRVDCSANYCYQQVTQDCANHNSSVSCNTNYGQIASLQQYLNDLFKNYLMRSNEYLLVKVNFDNYEFARPGFAHLYGELSERKWETAKRLMKYLSIRNVIVQFGRGNAYTNGKYDLFEVESLSWAVDTEKEFVIDTNEIDELASAPPNYDSSVSWYLKNKFAYQQSGVLRQLVGYLTNAMRMGTSTDYAVAYEQFDDMLADASV